MKVEVDTKYLPHITPLVMVVSGNNPPNPSTYIYFGQLNDNPPIVGVGMKEKRHTYSLIKEFKDFTVNIVNEKILIEADRAGFMSGKKYNKEELLKFSYEKSTVISSPYIKEAPVSYEVKFLGELKLFDHNLLYGEIVKIHADENYVIDGKVDLLKAGIIVSSYHSTDYYKVEKKVGKWGISLKEK